MAFWRFGIGMNVSSSVDKILDDADSSNDDKLQRLLAEDNLLQELKTPNWRLVDFIREKDILEKLLDIVLDCDVNVRRERHQSSSSSTSHDNDNDNNLQQQQQQQENNPQISPSHSEKNNNVDDDDDDDDDEQSEYTMNARIATEILSCEVFSIAEALITNSNLLVNFWTYLSRDAPLDTVTSGLFTRINESLLSKGIKPMLRFIKQVPNVVDSFVKHVDTPSIMDLLLKIISTDRPQRPTLITHWLHQQDLISKMLAYLGPDFSSTTQSSAGDFLKALVAISGNSDGEPNAIGPNDLSRQLVSHQCLENMIQMMLNGGGTGLATAVGLVIEIIRKNNSDYDPINIMDATIESNPPTYRDAIYLGTLLGLFSHYIPQFQQMLVKDRSDQVLLTPFGSIEPLGFERFKICELVAELLHCSNMKLMKNPYAKAHIQARNEWRLANEVISDDVLDQDQNDFDSTLTNPDNDNNNNNNNNDGDDDDNSSNNINNLVEDEDDNRPHHDERQHDEGTMTFDGNDNESLPLPPTTTSSAITPAAAESDFVNMEELEKVKNEIISEDTLSNPYHDEQPQQQQQQQQAEEDVMSEPEDRPVKDYEKIRPHTLDLNKEEPVVGDQLKIALIDNGVLPAILKIFFKFPWNNFLHNVVFDIVQQVLNGELDEEYPRQLAVDLFENGHITSLIVDGQAYSDDKEKNEKLRMAYMGHLTLIAEEVVKFTAKVESLDDLPQVVYNDATSPEWVSYVRETLVETREKYNAILGGQRPEDEDEDDGVGGGGNMQQENGGLSMDELDAATRQQQDQQEEQEEEEQQHYLDYNEGNASNQFSRYMSQEMSNDIPDRFASSDEEEEEEEVGRQGATRGGNDEDEDLHWHSYHPLQDEQFMQWDKGNHNNNNTSSSHHHENSNNEDDEEFGSFAGNDYWYPPPPPPPQDEDEEEGRDMPTLTRSISHSQDEELLPANTNDRQGNEEQDDDDNELARITGSMSLSDD